MGLTVCRTERRSPPETDRPNHVIMNRAIGLEEAAFAKEGIAFAEVWELLEGTSDPVYLYESVLQY